MVVQASRPSGDHAGAVSCHSLSVSCKTPLPSAWATAISQSVSPSTSLLRNARREPSGDQTGPPKKAGNPSSLFCVSCLRLVPSASTTKISYEGPTLLMKAMRSGATTGSGSAVVSVTTVSSFTGGGNGTRPRARARNVAICPRVTGSSGQNRAGSVAHPRVILTAANASMCPGVHTPLHIGEIRR